MHYSQYKLPPCGMRRVVFLIDHSSTKKIREWLISMVKQFQTEDAIYLGGYGVAISPGPITAAFANTPNFSCNIIQSLREAGELIEGDFDVVVIGKVDERRLERAVRNVEELDIYGRMITTTILDV